MQQKVYKSGSSLVVVVPSDFVDLIGVRKGDLVNVKADFDSGKLEYCFSGNKQLTFGGNFKVKKKK